MNPESSKKKKKVIDNLKLSNYKIYGIFDFDKKVLVYVHMKLEQVELEFDLEGYNDERYDIVSFEVNLL